MLYIWLSLHGPVQKTLSNEEIALISYVVFFLVTLVVVFVMFFVMFQKRKNQLLLDKVKQQKQFDEELIKTQQEIQEETLKYIGRELHDNVGQMLVLASMQMSAVSSIVQEGVKTQVQNASEVLKDSLEEVRALSRSLNNDVIYNLGFDATVQNEINRLNKTGLIEASLSISGDKVHFENHKDEVILFRILQEFFSNSLKYAEANQLVVKIIYELDSLSIQIQDDGVGFEVNTVKKGAGLINMKKRAELVSASLQLNSEVGKGTVLNLKYPFKIA